MELISSNFKRRIETVATIGIFDGIHLGHRYLLKKLVKSASQLHLPSLVITFWPHPQELLNKRFFGYITNLEQKKKILETLGIDYFLILRITKEFLRLSGEKFLKKICRVVAIKSLIVGEDFRFGYGAKSGIKELKKISYGFGLNVVVVKKMRIRNTIVSSSLIRRLIKKGIFSEVETFLGREYCLEAEVIKGEGLGRRIGYPTLNLGHFGFVIPKRGVYAVKVFLDSKMYLGLCNIGFRPTINKDNKMNIEVHILNYKKKIIKKKLHIAFLERIRDEKKYSSVDKLREAIQQDIKFVHSKYASLSRKD